MKEVPMIAPMEIGCLNRSYALTSRGGGGWFVSWDRDRMTARRAVCADWVWTQGEAWVPPDLVGHVAAGGQFKDVDMMEVEWREIGWGESGAAVVPDWWAATLIGDHPDLPAASIRAVFVGAMLAKKLAYRVRMSPGSITQQMLEVEVARLGLFVDLGEK